MLGKAPLPIGSSARTTIVAAVSTVSRREVPNTGMLRLREEVAAAFPNSLSSATLKQVDEQGLLALAALSDAVAIHRQPLSAYQNWGLITACRNIGRKRIADSLQKFRQQGAWSVSPHIIPHCSLHSISGMLSQALRLHGPNIGTGGVIGAEGESFWAALTWLHGEGIPGVWIVFTAWDQESISYDQSVCRAIVLGLTLPSSGSEESRLTFRPNLNAVAAAPFRFEEFWEAIGANLPWTWGIGGADCHWQPKTARRAEAA